nr:hypothetical protein [Candidatus Dojkabacteria bacterium]
MSKLNRNYSPLKQPSGTSRFQLNTVTSPDHIGNECNEPGNEFCVELPDKVIGTIILDREESLIFCLDNSINLINTKLCTIKKIVQLDCFNFQEDFEITGSTRIIRGCERVCYWHDHINPDRFINLTRPEKQQTDGEFDCDKFLFNSNIVHSKINREVLDFGGKLEYGTYNFAIEYLTSNEDSLFVTPIDVYYTPIIYQEKGALNISTNLPEVGGKPISNKSIRLVVENIPTDATYARIVVFRRLTSLGNTSDAHVINTLIPIQDNIFEYVYTGFNPSNGDYLVDKNEYVVPKAKYASSLNGVQVNNRYLRYNLKEDIRDYSIYQKVVNNITLKPYVKAVKPYQNQDWDTIGYQADEVYAKGIVFVYVDGTISPTFPLIGRAAFPSDLEELEVGVDIDESEVEHLGYSLGNLIPRWKVVNTGTANYIGQGSYNNLNFAYHESENGIYPTTKDCNGDFIFGSLAGQPIRHFKYPDRKTVLLYFPETDADLQNSLSPVFGFEADISTIVYPDSDIVGHYFVRGVRDNFNRTVLDSGYLMPARDPEALEENGVANPGIVISNSQYTRVENKRVYFTGTNTATSYNITLDKESRNWTFYSPKTQFKREFLNGEYFSFINNVGYQIEGNYSFLAYGVENSDYDINVRDARRSAFQPTDFTNRTYNSNIYVDSLSIQAPVQEFPTTLFNGSHSNNLNFYRFNQRIPLWTDYFDNHHNAYDFYYASNKQVADVFSNVLNISYYRAHTNILTNTEPNIVFGGDTFISIWNHVSID